MQLHKTSVDWKQDLGFLIYTCNQIPACACFMKKFNILNLCNMFKLQTSEKKGSYSLHGQQGDKVHGNERAGFLQKRSEG